MAKKTSFSIGMPGIIFMVIMYNFIFDDDDKNEVEIVEQDTIVQTSPAPEKPTIRDSLNELGVELKKTGKLLKEEATVIVEDLKSELEETPPEPEEEVEEEIVVVEKETTPSPLPEPEDTTGMKKL